MRHLINKSIPLFALLFLGSCASIIHGPKQDVFISSTPTRASVFIDGVDQGTTPKVLTLKRSGRMGYESRDKKGYLLELKLDGYYPIEMKISRSLDGWVFGNILFGGIIGIIIDAANGSIYRLSPDEIVTRLSPNTGSASIGNDDVYISVGLEIDPSWEKIGELVSK